MKQYHGIQVGDLVKFKHHIFDEFQPAHLVTKAWISKEGDGYGGPSGHIVLHGGTAQHRANNFVLVSKGKS